MPRTAPEEAQALKLSKEALAVIQRGDMATGKDQLVAAWKISPKSPRVLMVCAGSLIDIGENEAALNMLIDTFKISGESSELLLLAGEIADRLEMFEMGAKFYSRLIQLVPYKAEYYASLIECLRQSGKAGEALEIALAAIDRFPKTARLWNSLGVLSLNHLNKIDDARHFFECAVQIDPKNAIYRYNYATAIAHHPEFTETNLRAALRLAPKDPQINLTLGIMLLTDGRLEEGWKKYRFRNDPSLGYSKVAQYTHGIPFWRDGQSLSGKKVLVCAEQGIGDEVLFASAIPLLIDEAAEVSICCEPRLNDIFARSFPSANIYGYEDQRGYKGRSRTVTGLEKARAKDIDVAIHIGDLFAYYVQTYDDLKHFKRAYLKHDASLVDDVVSRYPALANAERLKIGISWRSGKMDNARGFYYLSLEFIEELIKAVDADFFVLQYAASDGELASLDKFDNVHIFTDHDLKKDIDFNLAAMSCMDLVIGPATATQSFALAGGTPIWLVNLGAPWNLFGSKDMPPFYPDGSRFFDLSRYLFGGASYELLLNDMFKLLENYRG